MMTKGRNILCSIDKHKGLLYTERFTHYLVVIYEVLQLVSMNNNVKTTVLGETELFIIHTRKANLLPRSRAVEKMCLREHALCYGDIKLIMSTVKEQYYFPVLITLC